VSICVVLVLSVFAAFQGLLSAGFLKYDDPLYVTENAHVQKGLSGESVVWAFTSTDATNWHPLTWLSHMLDVRLFGSNAGMHHLTSILLHALNAVLLFLLLFRMTGALWRSAFVAAVFALHPLHVESVAWIAERKDVLSTLFWLLTTGAWLAYVKSKKAVPYTGMLVFFALGLMAKPMLVTLPFTLLLLDYWPLQRLAFPLKGHAAEIRRLVWEKAPLFAMSAASCVITVIAQKTGGAVASLDQLPPSVRATNAARAYAAYLVKMVWPSSLAVYYPHPRSGLFTLSAAAAVLALAGATILVLRLGKKAPYLAFGWLWYLGTLVPVIGLVQVGKQAMADRYTYIPLIGIFIALAWGLAALANGSRPLRFAITAAALAVLSTLAILTRVQAGFWSGDEALFTHALAVTSDNDLAHYQIGYIRLMQGHPDEAISHLTEALRINPRIAESHNTLAIALDRRGRKTEALEHFREAVRLQEGNPQAKTNLGLALLKYGIDLVEQKHYGEAVSLFDQASTLPQRIPPNYLIQWGLALSKLGRYQEAADRFQSVLALDPGSGQAHLELGFALSQLQRHAEAISHYRAAYGKEGVRSSSILWIGDVYRTNGLCDEALQVYRIIPPSDPEYPRAAAGISACGGRP